jgi:hypothetical protein
MLLYVTMSNIFKDYEVMYCDNSLDSWMFYIGLYIWWILYYISIFIGLSIIVLLFAIPLLTICGLLSSISIKIKPTKHKKHKKNKTKHKTKTNTDYNSRLEKFKKKHGKL